MLFPDHSKPNSGILALHGKLFGARLNSLSGSGLFRSNHFLEAIWRKESRDLYLGPCGFIECGDGYRPEDDLED